MKKKLTCLLLAALMCTGALVSCGDPAETADTSAETSADTSAETQKDTSADTQTEAEKPEEEEPKTLEEKIERMKRITKISDITPADGKKLKVAFIGDSITQGTGTTNQATESYPAQLAGLLGGGYKVGNFGKASAYTLAADNKYNVKTDANLSYRNTQQYKDSVKFKPEVVVIMLGVNDIRSMSCDEAREALREALKDLTLEYCAMDSVKKVYIATSIMIPSSATIYQYSDGRLQDLQREVAEEIGLDVIDIYSMTRDYMNVEMHYTNDRIHPIKVSYGEMARAYYAALMGESYTATVPEKSDTGVVYVKTGGMKSGKGETPETALDSLAKAVGLLRDGGGTVVISGAYSLQYEMYLPHHTGNITITSVYGGTDYRKSGAKLGLPKSLYFYGDYKLDDLNIVSEADNMIIICNYNNVTFGKNIKSTLADGIKTYPLILVGHNVGLGDAFEEDLTLHGECNITVESGDWSYLRGGNRRANQAYPNFGSDADAVLNITISGGKFHNKSGTNLFCGTGMGGFDGTLNLTITGGEFLGDVYAVGRSGTNTTSTKAEMTGTVNMTVTGGTFGGRILAAQNDGSTTVTGKINLTVTSALKGKTSGFDSVTVQ